VAHEVLRHPDATMPAPFDDTPGTAPMAVPAATALEQEAARLARLTDPQAALVGGQAAIARFGPAPALLRLALAAGRSLLETPRAGATGPEHTRHIAVYVDALLEAAIPVASATAPLFMQVILALFARRRWARAELLLEAAIAARHPGIPQTWAHASLGRAREEVRALREGPPARTGSAPDGPRTP
jgi:hypothetical protein